MYRRYIWNYVRLENEHLFNVGQFRAVRDIYIKPIKIKTRTSVELQQMMDKKDGVVNRIPKALTSIPVMDGDEDDDAAEYD